MAADQVEATVETLASSLFGAGTPARALICEADGQPVATPSISSTTRPGRPGKGCTWKTCVSPASRGIGAGKRLLRHLARVAVEEGCGRFEWSVLDWNQPAIDFYQSIGARPQAEWVRYRMHGEALTGFAAGSD